VKEGILSVNLEKTHAGSSTSKERKKERQWRREKKTLLTNFRDHNTTVFAKEPVAMRCRGCEIKEKRRKVIEGKGPALFHSPWRTPKAHERGKGTRVFGKKGLSGGRRTIKKRKGKGPSCFIMCLEGRERKVRREKKKTPGLVGAERNEVGMIKPVRGKRKPRIDPALQKNHASLPRFRERGTGVTFPGIETEAGSAIIF